MRETIGFVQCVLFAMVAFWASPAPLRAQSSMQDSLKHRVERLRSAGTLLARGITITGSGPLARVYEQRAFKPLWTDARAASDLLRVLREVAADGLNPSDYNLPAIEELSAVQLTPSGAAELDLLRTDALIRVAYDLRYGKVDPARLESRRKLTGPLHGADPAADIDRVIASGRLYDDVFALRPDHFVYRGLRKALTQLRSIEQAGGWALIPAGAALRRDSTDARVALLRQRLVLEGDLSKEAAVGTLLFDPTLERALQSFQHRHGLNPDGILGPGTLAELNVSVATRISQVRINLERARWVTHDLPDTFVAVNVAGAMVYFVRDRTVLFETRAVVGKSYTATPVFRSALRTIDLNPTWTVPPGIVGEVLAAIRRNHNYLSAQNMRVLSSSGQQIDATGINFARYSARSFPYVFRQEPGPSNPLGRIKFVFPNPYNVYLHDTPAHELFEREQRTFSHGCIRVHEPLQLARLILNDSIRWNSTAIQAAIETGTKRTITLETPLTVLVLYWTASADLHGELHFYRDVYGRDAALLRALDRR